MGYLSFCVKFLCLFLRIVLLSNKSETLKLHVFVVPTVRFWKKYDRRVTN